MAKKVENGWVEVDKLRIHYLKDVEGDNTVLLLHGGGYGASSLSYKKLRRVGQMYSTLATRPIPE